MGKLIELNYPDDVDPAPLRQELHKVCDRLLVNPNTETYSLVLVRLDGKGGEQVLAGARR
jgi:phosphoribosylformylglycinamidine (FGAM) synthase PurS component